MSDIEYDAERQARKDAKKAAKKAKKLRERQVEIVPLESNNTDEHKKSKKDKKRKERSDEETNNDNGTDLFAQEEILLKREVDSEDDDNVDLSALRRTKDSNAHLTGLTGMTGVNGQTEAAEPLTRIFIGNLPFKVQDDHMYETFGDCGEIDGIHWVTDKTTGNFYGTAFVDFKEHEAAKAAVKKSGAEILGRAIKVNWATGANSTGANRYNKKLKKGAHLSLAPISDKPEGCTTVFLGNLSFEITDDVIRETFEKCGTITDIRWVEKDGEFKGCGFVEFQETEATDEAVKLNGFDVMGRAMRVDYSGNKQN